MGKFRAKAPHLAGHSEIEFIEQPMPATNPAADFIWLRERSPLTVIGEPSKDDREAATELGGTLAATLVVGS